ncbi:MAG: SDR family NAD(P)-dependent oxidoreductase [Solirubrobacterales bacterium]|nr:SDR family NAD(P)-dependent oxidoreductase [Solirubrobacterales bacterium]
MSYVALITGASSGIGEALARLLSSQLPDSRVVLVARREERIQALAAELNRSAPEPRAHAYRADLTDPQAPTSIAAYLQQNFGHLNLLVNNAGARWSAPFASAGYANVAQTMAINFDAQVQLTEAVLGLLRNAVAQNGATPESATARAAIVNVASTAARVSRPGTAAYSASKAALLAWGDGLHHELAPEGIHVGVVNPGFIATEGFPAKELRAHPLKRLLVSTPEKAAAAVLEAGPGGKAEVFVPGYYELAAIARSLAPGLLRRAVGGGSFNTTTSADAEH